MTRNIGLRNHVNSISIFFGNILSRMGRFTGFQFFSSCFQTQGSGVPLYSGLAFECEKVGEG